MQVRACTYFLELILHSIVAIPKHKSYLFSNSSNSARTTSSINSSRNSCFHVSMQGKAYFCNYNSIAKLFANVPLCKLIQKTISEFHDRTTHWTQFYDCVIFHEYLYRNSRLVFSLIRHKWRWKCTRKWFSLDLSRATDIYKQLVE